jgi:hypothetical protein
VQLIRPDGVRCEENMGAGCFLCVKDKWLERIPAARTAGAMLGPLADLLANAAGKGEFADLSARQDFVLSAFASADLLISPSRFLRQKLLDTGAFDAHRFLYSDNGMRTDHVHALEKRRDPMGRVRLGFVGSLVWYKGGEVLMEAMRLLAGTRAVLHVHGEFKPETDDHHRRLQELARGADVVFHGRFDNARLSDVYADLDVLVVPSVWFENAPVTIQEAFLTRTPVVASDIGGMAEFVRDGADGLHFKAGDAQDLARVLRRFVDEPGLIERLSQSFPHVRTAADDACEMEFRYRALCCQSRATAPRVLLDFRGTDTLERRGVVDAQGADMLLLRPGGGAVEYSLELAGAGRREIAIDVFALAAERRVELGGRVLVDGREIGRIAPFHSGGQDGARTFTFEVVLPPKPKRLSIECRTQENGRECFLRVKRVVVREAAAREAVSSGAGL